MAYGARQYNLSAGLVDAAPVFMPYLPEDAPAVAAKKINRSGNRLNDSALGIVSEEGEPSW
jgi:hypothetical protein